MPNEDRLLFNKLRMYSPEDLLLKIWEESLRMSYRDEMLEVNGKTYVWWRQKFISQQCHTTDYSNQCVYPKLQGKCLSYNSLRCIMRWNDKMSYQCRELLDVYTLDPPPQIWECSSLWHPLVLKVDGYCLGTVYRMHGSCFTTIESP